MSERLTIEVPVETFPDASVAVQVTVLAPMSKVVRL